MDTFHRISQGSKGSGQGILLMKFDRRAAQPRRAVRKKVVDSEALSAREQLLLFREKLVLAREQAVSSGEQRSKRGFKQKRQQTRYLAILRQANSHLVVASMEAVKIADQLRHTEIELSYLASHDVLTKLPNRLLLGDRLHQAIELARRHNTQMAVMFIDLDRFKHINDSLGHAVGDQLLKSVAQSLISCVRSSDTVSRQGGDEFILLLPEIDGATDAAAIAQKILASMLLPHKVGNHALYIGLSIGVSLYPQDGLDAATLIGHADLAMYHAKDAGRNNCTFFETGMNARAVMRQSTEAALHNAFAREEFVLHYQPKISLASGRLVGVEALVRWQHPQRGLLHPQHFVPIAEDCGLILPLGRWVLRKACEQAQEWAKNGWPAVTMSINTSTVEFRANDFLAFLCRTLAETALPPNLLELELTESMFMRDPDMAGILLQNIASLGVKLAIDDFGTGYSSLSYLTQLPVHTLKIDQSFVSHISSNIDDATLVSAVISMGKNLNKRVIAEGIETQAQCEFLRAHGCDEGQGFFFGHPMDADGIVAMLQASATSVCVGGK